MKWEDFKAEAERIGVQPCVGDEGEWWLYHPSEDIEADDDDDYNRFPRIAWNQADDEDRIAGHPGYIHITSHRGEPADALREAARMMRGDVAGKMREWLEAERTEMHTMFKRLASKEPAMAAAWNTRGHDMGRVLAKLDELEGKP